MPTSRPLPSTKSRPVQGERQRATRPRKAFPAHKEHVAIVIEPETVTCGCRDCRPVRVGEDVSERLDVTPATCRVVSPAVQSMAAPSARRCLAGGRRRFRWDLVLTLILDNAGPSPLNRPVTGV
jgi:transposase